MSSLLPDPLLALPSLGSNLTQGVLLLAVSTLAERRDADTEGHLLRVQGYLQVLAHALREVPELQPILTDEYIANLLQGALVYDIGTLALPDRVLLKPGRYTPAERLAMQSHTLKGFEALAQAEKTCGASDPGLQMAKEMALSHHEHWDGHGYPHKRSGLAIPLCARILAVADVYDAMISHKVYKEGISHAQAVVQIQADRGRQFDPMVVDAFLACADQFERIAHRHADSDEDLQHKMEHLAQAIAEHTEM